LLVEGTSIQYAETEVQLARLLFSSGKPDEAVDHAKKGFQTHRMLCGEEDERTSNVRWLTHIYKCALECRLITGS
jgi:hypothetical protein